MYCLIRTDASFMSYEHKEAVLFSTNKQALESIARRISLFVTDDYSVIELANVSKCCNAIMFCHQDDSDVNYSIIHDDHFMEDGAVNGKVLAKIIIDKTKSGADGLGIKVMPVMTDVTRDTMASIFSSIGGDYGRQVRSYRDFATLLAGLRRLRNGVQSDLFYQSNEYSDSLFEYHGFVYELSNVD